MSIFIAVPGYQDTEFIPTIENAFSKADNPQDVYIGSRYLSTFNDELDNIEEWVINHKYSDNIKIDLVLVNEHNRFQVFGSTKGRQGSANFYADQDYFMSIDSHTIFSEHWDSRLIELHKESKKLTGNEKTIVTAYAGSYGFNDSGDRYFRKGHLYQYIGFPNKITTRHIQEWMTRPLYSICLPWITEELNSNYPKLLPATKFAYNFSFSDKCFIYEEDLDVYIIEEDIIKTWKLIKDGWTFVHPNTKEPILAHLYHPQIGKFGERAGVKGAVGINNEWKYIHQEVRNVLKYLDDPEYKDTISKYESWLKVKFKEHSLHNWYMPDTFI